MEACISRRRGGVEAAFGVSAYARSKTTLPMNASGFGPQGHESRGLG